MARLRHEEYVLPEGNLPFVFQGRIVRTSSTCVQEQNWHENLEIQLCLEGSGEVLLDGEKYPFEKGDFIVVNSNVIHYTSTPERLVYACLIVDTAFCRRVGIDSSSVRFLPRVKSARLKEDFSRLQELVYTETSFKTAKLNAVVLSVLLELCECALSSKEEIRKKDRAFECVKSAISYIRSSYAEKLSLEGLAQKCYADKYFLSRAFKRITGQTVVTYVNRFRCMIAAKCIEEGAGVAEAAYSCGFENVSFFIRTFKRYMGKLPSCYKP